MSTLCNLSTHLGDIKLTEYQHCAESSPGPVHPECKRTYIRGVEQRMCTSATGNRHECGTDEEMILR